MLHAERLLYAMPCRHNSASEKAYQVFLLDIFPTTSPTENGVDDHGKTPADPARTYDAIGFELMVNVISATP